MEMVRVWERLYVAAAVLACFVGLKWWFLAAVFGVWMVHADRELWRWQLIPLYLSTHVLLPLTLLSANFTWLSWLLWLLAVLLTLAGALFSQVLFPVPVLPKPSGPHHVATAHVHLPLESQLEGGEENCVQCYPIARRSLTVKLWYPCQRQLTGPLAAYLPYPDVVVPHVVKAGMSDAVPGWAGMHMRLITTNALVHAPLLPYLTKPTLPVVLLSHGLSGLPEHYTGIAEHLASHGFVVAAPWHTDGSASANVTAAGELDHKYLPLNPALDWAGQQAWNFRSFQVNRRVSDLARVHSFLRDLHRKGDSTSLAGSVFSDRREAGVTDGDGGHAKSHYGTNFGREESFSDFAAQFQGRLDVEKAAVVGHSFGGASSVLACLRLPGVLCGVSLDTWLFSLRTELKEPQQAPHLHLNSDLFQWRENLMRVDTTCEHSHALAVHATLLGTNHHNYSDMPHLLPILYYLRRWVPKFFGPRDPLTVHNEVCQATTAFINPPNRAGDKGAANSALFEKLRACSPHLLYKAFTQGGKKH